MSVPTSGSTAQRVVRVSIMVVVSFVLALVLLVLAQMVGVDLPVATAE